MENQEPLDINYSQKDPNDKSNWRKFWDHVAYRDMPTDPLQRDKYLTERALRRNARFHMVSAPIASHVAKELSYMGEHTRSPLNTIGNDIPVYRQKYGGIIWRYDDGGEMTDISAEEKQQALAPRPLQGIQAPGLQSQFQIPTKLDPMKPIKPKSDKLPLSWMGQQTVNAWKNAGTWDNMQNTISNGLQEYDDQQLQQQQNARDAWNDKMGRMNTNYMNRPNWFTQGDPNTY